MAHVAIYILATDKNLHRLQVMCAGGIRGKKNSFIIVLMGEGKKPDFLNKNMKWIPWGNYRVTDKHILAFNKGILENADYHLFCDDDCFVDVDNMVKCLDNNNIIDFPCYWSQPALGSFIKDIPSITDFFYRKSKRYCDFEHLKSSWIGWCWTVVNKKFVEVAKESIHSKLVLEYSLTLNQFIPDYQVCILGSLIKAKHFYSESASSATQWKDYFNYSGIVKKAPLWLIHYTIDNKILDFNDLIKTVDKGSQKIDDAIYSMFSSQFKRGVKPKNFLNKNYVKKYFFVYWGYHAWHHPVADNAMTGILTPNRNGEIAISNESKKWNWKQGKKGIILLNELNIPVSELRWITKNGIIGKNLIHGGRVLDLFEIT